MAAVVALGVVLTGCDSDASDTPAAPVTQSAATSTVPSGSPKPSAAEQSSTRMAVDDASQIESAVTEAQHLLDDIDQDLASD